MGHDILIERGESFGEWLHKEILEAVTLEDAPWAIERIRRVETRLQAGRPQADRLKVEFDGGKSPPPSLARDYIYFSRRLYEVCATDEQVAFVVGHEIAHHDLGHVALFHGWTDKIIHLPGATLFALFFPTVWSASCIIPKRNARRIGTDWSCVSAGDDGGRCLELFDILEQRALYIGDLDMVYGPDADSDSGVGRKRKVDYQGSNLGVAEEERISSHSDRRQMLKKHLETRGASVQKSLRTC